MRAAGGRPKTELQIFWASNTRPTFSLNPLISQRFLTFHKARDEREKSASPLPSWTLMFWIFNKWFSLKLLDISLTNLTIFDIV